MDIEPLSKDDLHEILARTMTHDLSVREEIEHYGVDPDAFRSLGAQLISLAALDMVITETADIPLATLFYAGFQIGYLASFEVETRRQANA